MAENDARVPPATDPSRLTTAELLAALRALPYREAAFLHTRLTQGRSLAESAAFYAISPDAFSVHLLRAALGATHALSLPCRAPEGDAEEDVWARALAAAIEREGGAAVPAALVAPVALCRRLHALGAEVMAALQAAEREEEESPARRKEDWLRRGAVLVLLALTAYLYFTRPPEETPRSSIPARGPSR